MLNVVEGCRKMRIRERRRWSSIGVFYDFDKYGF